jgi:antitoxin component YwqK of YwqJK toxin-antitoxin module
MSRKRGRDSPTPEEHITRQLNSLHFPTKKRRETLEEISEEGDFGSTNYCINSIGQREGEYRSYFPNGQIREMANYDKGERYGLIQQWFSNGHPFEVYTLIAGQRNGAAITWFSNGMIRCYEHYKNGSLDGSSIYYNESGNKQIERIYKDGTIIREQYYE